VKETLVIRVDPERRQWWKKTLQELLPNLRVVLFDEDDYEVSAVKYAVVWDPPLGAFSGMSSLRCVASVGAGVSHILKDPDYPRDVPIIRTIGESLRLRMSEYVALHVLRYHRRLPEVMAAHEARCWTQHLSPLASDVSIGIMGVGNLGSFAAHTLSSLGYRVSGWSRRPKEIEGLTSYHGDDQLTEFLSSATIFVCMLPQTSRTENILCRNVFAVMPDGSALINVGRGECLVESDLLDALDSGKLHGATLDVFREEPLSVDSPLWGHPKVLITCHTASAIDPAVGGELIAANLRAFIRGDDVPDIIDMEQGY